jgi:hypothetical protein
MPLPQFMVLQRIGTDIGCIARCCMASPQAFNRALLRAQPGPVSACLPTRDSDLQWNEMISFRHD